ncbi:MAG: hypothetical protein LUH56_08605 [Oscillospiraceae bacterium]|nr:hypothetical protein [Oscillospiraceae bacterium]
MKKILAVATALVLAISSLCVFVVADETVVAMQTSTGTLTILSGADFTDDELYLRISYTLDDSSCSGYGAGALCDTSWSNVVSIVVDSTGLYEISLVDLAAAYDAAGYDATSGVVLNFWGTNYSTLVSAELVQVSSSSSTTETVVAEQTSTGTLTILSGADFTDDELYLYVNYTLDDSSCSGYGAGAVCNTSWTSVESIDVDSTGLYKISLVQLAADFDAAGYDVTSGVILNYWGTSYSTLVSAQLVRVTDKTSTTSTTRTSGVIYIDETYHGILVNTTGRRMMACVPHTVDANGYCTVCHEYIGTDGEVATTTINGGEYVAAYSKDTSIAASNWTQVTLDSDTSLMDALSIEGAILVIERDTETLVSYADEEYEKILFIDSWWSNNSTPISLGTAGHTSADEDVIDCLSDDGITIIYDGATIYQAWVDGGYAEGGSELVLISNTSASYKIINVTVYVPAGTVIEEVAVDEPAEDTNSETEDDELDVDDTDAEEVTETNPTTGAVLALVPMAIAGFAVVASKRK